MFFIGRRDNMIQVATYSGKEIKYNGKLVEQYSLHDIRSLDEYNITVIDVGDPQLWRNQKGTTQTINRIADLKSIAEMIQNSTTCQIVFLLPQNVVFEYDWYNGYHSSIELKNMLNDLMTSILSKIYQPISKMCLIYENTKTQVDDKELSASFYFQNERNILLSSMKSNKAIAIESDKKILTTLNIDRYESLISFLHAVHLMGEKVEIPEWISEIQMFDDKIQKDVIQECNERIGREQECIDAANQVLVANSRLKSALYTSGDTLVDVVFEILEEMLGCDLSQFVDVKKEDFLFTIENTTFIGEIKGVNHNVKNSNVAQLEMHYQDYLDANNGVQEESVKALLIMNHQKNKPMVEREPVMEAQINLASRYGSLIIDTYTLLKILEKYRQGVMSREEIIKKLKETTGLLSI